MSVFLDATIIKHIFLLPKSDKRKIVCKLSRYIFQWEYFKDLFIDKLAKIRSYDLRKTNTEQKKSRLELILLSL